MRSTSRDELLLILGDISLVQSNWLALGKRGLLLVVFRVYPLLQEILDLSFHVQLILGFLLLNESQLCRGLFEL